MANIRSARKRVRQNLVRAARNKAVKTRVRSVTREARTALAAGDADRAAEALRVAASVIDRAAGKGILHRNAAARKKSRLAKHLNALAAKP